MIETDNIGVTLEGLLYSLPFLLLWLGGMVMAFLQRKRHPTAALLSGIGCGVMLLTDLMSTAVIALVNLLALGHLGGVMTAFNIVTNLLFAIGLALMVAAAWTGRAQ